jgi:membrane protease YdiL (CAAX protease family)
MGFKVIGIVLPSLSFFVYFVYFVVESYLLLRVQPMPSRRLLGGALVFAMIFPTVMTWWYFRELAGGGESRGQQLAYGVGKVIQFTFPVVFLWITVGWPRPGRPHFAGLAWGLAFGLIVAAAMLALYCCVLRDSVLFQGTADLVRGKLVELGAATPARYLGLAAFVVLGHSLLEEYYWRWFVFGRLRYLLPLGLAITLSSLAFMSHHVVVLAVYFPDRFWVATVPLSLGVAIGGALWAWLYNRTGSIWSPWLSHLIIDAAIFAIGWDLAFSRGS